MRNSLSVIALGLGVLLFVAFIWYSFSLLCRNKPTATSDQQRETDLEAAIRDADPLIPFIPYIPSNRDTGLISSLASSKNLQFQKSLPSSMDLPPPVYDPLERVTSKSRSGSYQLASQLRTTFTGLQSDYFLGREDRLSHNSSSLQSISFFFNHANGDLSSYPEFSALPPAYSSRPGSPALPTAAMVNSLGTMSSEGASPRVNSMSKSSELPHRKEQAVLKSTVWKEFLLSLSTRTMKENLARPEKCPTMHVLVNHLPRSEGSLLGPTRSIESLYPSQAQFCAAPGVDTSADCKDSLVQIYIPSLQGFASSSTTTIGPCKSPPTRSAPVGRGVNEIALSKDSPRYLLHERAFLSDNPEAPGDGSALSGAGAEANHSVNQLEPTVRGSGGTTRGDVQEDGGQADGQIA
jgi:hypothetical protein